jgi:hypothetical protein
VLAYPSPTTLRFVVFLAALLSAGARGSSSLADLSATAVRADRTSQHSQR